MITVISEEDISDKTFTSLKEKEKNWFGKKKSKKIQGRLQERSTETSSQLESTSSATDALDDEH